MGLDEAPTPVSDSLDVSILQELQDSVATVARVCLGICDGGGRLVTRPSCGGPLCRLMLESEQGQAACARSIEAAAAAGTPPAGDAAEPITANCHAGLGMVSLPIMLEGRHLGTVVVGNAPGTPVDGDGLSAYVRGYGLDEAAVAEAVDLRDKWTEDQRQAAFECAHLLARFITQICRQDVMLRDRVEELTAVYSISGLLAGTENLEAILKTAARMVAEVMKVKACLIRLLDELTGELVMMAGYNLSDAYLNKGPVMSGRSPIDDAVLTGKTVYVADAAADPRTRYPEQARKEGLVSGLGAPMAYRGQTVGVIRVYTGEHHRFSQFEASLLRAVGSQAAAAIVTARLFSQRKEAERYRRQLEYAGEIQRRMIPAAPPRHPNLTFGGVYAPTLEVGGDLYDFIVLPEGNVGLCVADVVGKGVPAALLMASVRSALRAHAHSIFQINEIMAQVNRQLCRDTLVSEFATLFYGVFAPDGSRFTYCSAGHEPPLLLRGDEFKRLETGGMVIGLSPEAEFDKEVLELQQGDVLLFVTDGVTEAANFEGEQFGRQRLRQSILRHRGEDANGLAKQVLWDVRRFAGLAPQTDDLTIVAAKVG